MSNKLLELARYIVRKEVTTTHGRECAFCECDLEKDNSPHIHVDDCVWFLLKNEVERIDYIAPSLATVFDATTIGMRVDTPADQP